MKKSCTIKLDAPKVSKGHQPHRSGSGVHKDRRTKRNRTRNASTKKEIGTWNQ